MKWTEEHRANHKAAFADKKGKNHWNWKGKEVGYKSLHEWLRANYDIGSICEKCGRGAFLEWANKEGKYTRNLKDWLRLCRSCHKTHDGIINNIHKMRSRLSDSRAIV